MMTYKKPWFVPTLIVLAAIIAVLAFEYKGSSVEENRIAIGVALPFTGAASDTGELSKNATLLAQEHIRSRYGADSVNLIFEDSKYEPKAAVSAVRKLIDIDKVNYIVGPYSSAEVEASAPLAEDNHVIMIVPGAQSESISRLGDYVFRLIHNTAQEAPVFADFVSKQMEDETLDFLTVKASISEPYLGSFTPTFLAAGKKIGINQQFDTTTTDFRPLLLKIKATNNKDLFLLSPPKLTGIILKQATELGIKRKFFSIGVESPELVRIAGIMAEGLLYPYSYDSESGNKEAVDFKNEYVRRFSVEPDAVAVNTYDGIILIHKCATVDKNVEAVKECIYKTKNHSGASGTFSIDDKGDAVRSIFIKTIRGGKFVKLN
jgi:branched-chain amino acid transport system substrate-binding protein